MKRVVSFCCALVFSCGIAAIPAHSQDLNQLLQGSEIRLTLQSGLTTEVAHSGDPFTAVVSEPVYVNHQLVLPAGTKIKGLVGAVITPRHFALFRGQAAMNLAFHSIEIDQREVPVEMSILAIQSPYKRDDGYSKKRGDLKLQEGQVVQEKPDVKGDVLVMALGTTGGSVVGAVFSHVMRGFAIGMIGSAAYVVARKGKEVELPVDTQMLVRLDNTLTLPTVASVATASSRGSN